MSDTVLYCFTTHRAVLDKDILSITKMCDTAGVLNYLLVCGGSKSDILDKNILYLNCADTYEGLVEKVHKMFSYISNNLIQYTHYAKLDRTTLIKKSIPKELLHNKDYCGVSVRVKDGLDGNRLWHKGKCSLGSTWNDKKYPGKFIPWCRGLGYILSHKAAQIISCHPPKIDYHIYEDLYISETLYDYSDIRPIPFSKINDYIVDRE